jgi:hypothetical protein
MLTLLLRELQELGYEVNLQGYVDSGAMDFVTLAQRVSNCVKARREHRAGQLP